jgi:hypothetical protein
MTKSVRAPAWLVVLIFSFKVVLTLWLSLLVLRLHRSYALKHRDLSWIMLSMSALQAIVDGTLSAHTRIPAVLEERAMPMIA